jgi:hypothetical protein
MTNRASQQWLDCKPFPAPSTARLAQADHRRRGRVTNHGPEGFSASPAGIVSCRYEAGVRVCRFLKAGTVELTITKPAEVRSITIVGKN